MRSRSLSKTILSFASVGISILALSACGGGSDSPASASASTSSGTSTNSSTSASSGRSTSSSSSTSSGASTSSSSSTSSGAGTSSSSSTGSSSGTPATSTDVLTYHNDTLRTGQNLTETTLTPANVKSTSFGLLKILSADSAVHAMPLVASNLTISGSAHNVVYVATENDTVYAYDANTFALLLPGKSLLGSGESVITTVCSDDKPSLGITATGVIDRSAGPNGTLFVVAMSQDANGNAIQRLHALDLTTLADRFTPTAIQATYPGTGPGSANGMVTFDPAVYKERGALLLSHGLIYTGWASHCDVEPPNYTGWIIAYDESTLAQASVLNITPSGDRGAVWNTGGLLADSAGNLFAAIANGSFDANPNFGNTMLRLTSSSGALGIADYFTPSGTQSDIANDVDFGSGTPVGLPDQTDASGNARQLLFTGTKGGRVFLLDRTNLGKFNATADTSYQQLSQMAPVFSAPAYYNGSVYLGAVGQALYAYTLSQARLPATPNSQTSVVFAYPGASPSVSANGTSNGIVWAVESSTGSAAVLHAYNPANLGAEYYNSNQAASARDAFGNGNKFVTPVIANGKVFVATPSGVAVFGLL